MKSPTPWLALTLLACGGATPAPAAVDTNTSARVEPAPDPVSSAAPVASPSKTTADPPLTLPTACAEPGSDICVPGAAFADRVCNGAQPDLALALFAKGSPWTRIYLKGDVDGWNAEGGASARARLQFDEEVVVLKRRLPPKNSVIVGAAAGYQVMRWDGNCYSLEEGEITARHPPRAKHPLIMWRYLTEGTRDVLLADPNIKRAYDKRGKECKGAMSGEVPIACEHADTALSDGVVDAVKGGLTVPFVLKTAP